VLFSNPQYFRKCAPCSGFCTWNSSYSNGGFTFSEGQTSLKRNFASDAYPGNVCSISFGDSPNCVEGDFILGSDGKRFQAISDKNPMELYSGKDGEEVPILSFIWYGYMINRISVDVAHPLFFNLIWSAPCFSTVNVVDMTNGQNIIQWADMWIREGQVSYSADGNLAAFNMSLNPGVWFILNGLDNRKMVYQAYSSWNNSGEEIFPPDGKSLIYYLVQPGK
jgi:hypothetical protein